MLPACPNRKSHHALDLEYQAARLFDESANYETLLELYDRALEERNEDGGISRILERRAALVRRKDELALERKGYLRQNARGQHPGYDLDAMLAEVDEQLKDVRAELRVVEDEAAAARRIEAARESLSSYNPVHAEWYEDPDAVSPDEVLTHAAGPEDRRRPYRRYGARFEVDGEGSLTLRLDLALDGGVLNLTSTRS
jgi:hypothetical protein